MAHCASDNRIKYDSADLGSLSGKTGSLERRPTAISGKSRPAVTNAMCEPTMDEHLAPHGSLQACWQIPIPTLAIVAE
jgi:hypothetical protein